MKTRGLNKIKQISFLILFCCYITCKYSLKVFLKSFSCIQQYHFSVMSRRALSSARSPKSPSSPPTHGATMSSNMPSILSVSAAIPGGAVGTVTMSYRLMCTLGISYGDTVLVRNAKQPELFVIGTATCTNNIIQSSMFVVKRLQTITAVLLDDTLFNSCKVVPGVDSVCVETLTHPVCYSSQISVRRGDDNHDKTELDSFIGASICGSYFPVAVSTRHGVSIYGQVQQFSINSDAPCLPYAHVFQVVNFYQRCSGHYGSC